MIERINVSRNHSGEITGLTFDKSAGVYFGKGFSLKESASFFKGKNAHGNELLGGITGYYSMADTKDLTPSGTCKESGCNESSSKMLGGLRPNNVPICPIMTSNDNAYITFGGGGLFVLDATVTPMKIVAEYGNNVINGAGLCGSVSGHMVFLNSGTSASPSGSNQSTSTLYAFDDDEISTMNTSGYKQNWPMPTQVFKDGGNTRTIGNSDGVAMTDQSGQHPRNATRRDSHGLAIHNGAFIHMTDRIRNVIDVFSVDSYQHVNTYDLVSIDGKSGRNGAAGACFKRSVLDDEALPLNDPAPDLVDITPDGKYLVIAFRGPLPVTVPHAAQGSCVGVGIVSLSPDGKSGKLVDVLRTTNTVDNVKNSEGRTAGGHDYIGSERSDVHYAIAIKKTF